MASCPKGCKGRVQEGTFRSTMVFYPVVRDAEGKNVNPDRNKKVQNFKCLECGKEWSE